LGRLFGVAAVVGLVLAGGSAYGGQNANGSISVSPSIAHAGSSVHIAGSISPEACPASDSAIPVSTAAFFPPDGFGTATDRDSQGTFDLAYSVPTSTPAGSYQIRRTEGVGSVDTHGRRKLRTRSLLLLDVLAACLALAGFAALGSDRLVEGTPVRVSGQLRGSATLEPGPARATHRPRSAGVT